jgi:uncharacterized protein with NRDE domain
MCLILLAYGVHPAYGLVVAANRDEFYERPTEAARFWDDAPEVLAGRDLTRGGTWLGVTRGGRFAAVTNYRDPRALMPDAPSRGHLVADFLRGSESPARYLARVAEAGARFNGFNLLAGDAGSLHYYSNRGGAPRRLAPGVYGLSNHLLDTSWPKVEAGKRALAALVTAGGELEIEGLFRVLSDREPAEDSRLPDTGVGLEAERMLSPLFITGPRYGTRCSTVILAGRDRRVEFVERTFVPGAALWEEARHEFEAAAASGRDEPASARGAGRCNPFAGEGD